ncbi:39S ribosomal protein L40, mitochondrial [Eurytemora carolleeae]|uniref:39S ribosomal protein L40, mitochondrial n=1 Tax=Eurytemora carolleeae TaxID=1294199 RepID=UPI000C772CFD|nr:39S ribosomal protein L40, mitochondrial [Eurytemora carolleeae]|eukprot:XP_023338053.1 39S ribosomal protein L40, mitochondrial-like [Eurytemora affinis]
MNSLISSVSRLSLCSRTYQRSLQLPVSAFHTSTINNFKLTDVWSGGVTKKKRRTDPGSTKVKDDRRRKRLAKALRKMEKKERQPKPVIELEVPQVLFSESKLRTRNLQVPEDIREERHYFFKDWALYAQNRHRNEIYELDTKILAQQEALDQLRMESLDLYLAACQFDPDLIPFTARGPTLSPPIKDYIQDGDFKDITREYKVVYEDTEAFLKKLVTKVRRRKKRSSEEDDD